MRFNPIKVLALLIIFSVSATAQINNNPSALHGSYKKGDTNTDYQDKPSMHVHEEVKIIKEKQLTPAQAEKMGLKVPPYMQHKGGQASAARDTSAAPTDTAAQTAAAPVDSQNAGDRSSGMIVTSLIDSNSCDCIGKNFICAALMLIGLGFLFDLYLLIQMLRDQKRSGFLSVLHALLATAGMTLFITYCIFQPAPIIALVSLVIAVLLGLALLYNDISYRPSSKALAIIQAAVALIGIVLLAIFICVH